VISVSECRTIRQLVRYHQRIDLLGGLVVVWRVSLVIGNHLCSLLDPFDASPGFLLLVQLRNKLWISELCT